jgi:predicted enzyme related to lactoylglutathione lyase
MNNVAVWFELPTTDLDRAETFYRAVFGHPMRRETSPDGNLEMCVFDPPGAEMKGALVKGAWFEPGLNGALVYLNGGDDLAVPLSRVEAAGGRIAMPKTAIGPHGHIALFIDSEGNRVGLHSMA